MCGRTACTLAPDEWCAACRREGLEVDWRDAAKQTYFPSYNVAPTSNTPVIVGGELLETMAKEKISADYIVQPMMWNLIPHFYKGDTPQNHGYKTNNCRVESVLEKPMFSHLMKKGRRCVVLCDGFYEWQTKGTTKTPYFIYAPQPKNVKVWDRSTWLGEVEVSSENLTGTTQRQNSTQEENSTGNQDSQNSTEEQNPSREQPPTVEPWCGLRPLMLAGLFSQWHSSEHGEGEGVWSYTVLTTEAGPSFGWLHHRVPVVLSDAAAVRLWLDPSLEPAAALKLVKSEPALEWHAVSSEVNNSRNKSKQCLVPAQQKKTNEGPSNPIMAGWLKRGAASSSKDEPGEKTPKRQQDSSPDSDTEKKKPKL